MASAGQPSNALQNMLRTAVQSVQWTYSLFWHLCPDQGILVWGDGYYNGAIKTRKTVQPMEVSTEEASLQRSQQLRELYDSLSAGETNQPARRPCAALSPEDLTESEWFYLMCVSFSFQPGVGLPGKAYTRRQHVWLTGANEVDSKVFSRAILAKSARVQTVVCIPLMNGVVELGTTERVQEDSALVQHVKTFFLAHHHHQNPTPKPALSGHSTSNPATSCDHHRRYQSSQPTPLAIYAAADPPADPNEEGDEEEEDDDDEEAVDSDSGAETARQLAVEQSTAQGLLPEGGAGEPSELMQLEMSEDIRLGSPDDASNNLDSEFQLMGVSPGAIPGDQQRRTDSYRAESILRWPLVQETTNCAVPPPSSATPALDELTEEDTHYSQTVSTILQHRPSRWPQPSAAAASGINFSFYTAQSAFCKWIPRASELHLTVPAVEGAGSQWLLKYILFTVPFLHTSKSAQKSDPTSRLRRTTGTPQEELSANHVLAERRRREKLNERFIILRSLVPFVTKMDKASILGDTIEYVKQLRRKIQDLEAKPRAIEPERMVDPPPPQRTASVPRSGLTRAGLAVDKRKMRIVEGGGTAKTKAVDSAAGGGGVQVEVSIIESDALVELQCPFREGLLLDVMLTLRDVRLETTAVQSSLNNGVFAAELRAKVKENHLGKKASIMEVKRAIHQIIP